MYQRSHPNSKDSNGDGFTDTEITNLGGQPMWDLTNTIASIQDNANRFGLFDSNDISLAESAARTAGQQDVITMPTNYNLFGEDAVEDVKMGAVMVKRNSGQSFNFEYEIQASSNLTNWTTLETPVFQYSPAPGKEFLRIRITSE